MIQIYWLMLIHLSDVFSLLACPNCSTTNTCKLLNIEDKKKGLARFMQITYFGFRSIGVGDTPLTKSCGLLNMSSPWPKILYNGLSYPIKIAPKQVVEKRMSDATARLCETKKTADVGVSVDGTWQREGFWFILGG